jgi:hypothetical protein
MRIKPLLTLALVPLLLAACNSDSSTSSRASARQIKNRGFVRATVTRHYDAYGNKVKPKTITIEDPVKIQQLISFFPGADTGRTSPTVNEWKPTAEVRLIREDKSSLLVRSDYKVWSEGNRKSGDFPLRGPFRQHVASLFP